ncbi:ATP-dependent DNA helicase [Corynebacterium liangguodongii]|uniref:DNA 3'-5' helicase n=1 Tax=Corynebacterium liangguodongii TaxID=2079535 RepID=A0A2S0WD10_9CORY|nr:ATP-dependent DNA helicase [Corynebacterium liangguodongii]AWB83562.1 ATP-dependent DNA helicase [Corynebacterium liangguodongii]PWC00349.1 ATP-dependent helicase [Corynebacterium liangguodongii]
MSIASPLPPTPRAYLVPRERRLNDRRWDHPLPTEGTWKVTGQAGSGVSSFLIDTVVNAVASGADPRGILVVAASKESGARMRVELSDRLAASGFVIDEPMVRSVHSLAFALLRQQSGEDIRLISGAEQDAVIRQLLAGHVEDGRGTWPVELRPALPLLGFARQLRDFLLRAVERGATPADLRALGQRHGRPIWAASGDFLEEYLQVMALNPARTLSASELVTQVLRAEVEGHWHTVVVDDAQHLAPAPAELVARLAARARLAVVGGDLGQSVFHFRGASPNFFRDLGGIAHETINLGPSRRGPQRRAVVCPSAAAQHCVVADELRRAHLEAGEAYRDMAVIVRSSAAIEPMRRALLQAGVPVMLDPTDVVLGEQRIVAALVLGLRALTEDLDPAAWRELLLGPVGGTDPVTYRRLLRGLRRYAPARRAEDTLRDLVASPNPLPDFGAMLTERELDILLHVRAVLDAGRAELGSGSVEEILWAVWNATGLSSRLLAAALRGGATGSQADRDLDAVMALFDAAGDFTERRGDSGIKGFISYIADQELPTGVRDRRTATPDAVYLLTAHGAAGREFARVVVAGVQELEWPSLAVTGTIFGQEELVDLLDNGVDPSVPVSRKAERAAEERRLFTVATTRATESLLVTAVDDPDGDEVVSPSRFVEEWCAAHDVELRFARAEHAKEPLGVGGGEALTLRVLAHDDLIAELRRAARSDALGEAGRAQAARQLARLAEAGVPGADPGQWWATTTVASEKALPVPKKLSPSRIEGLLACPMNSVLERMVGLDGSMRAVYGAMAHAYLEALGRGVDEALARAEVLDARRSADASPAWKRERDIEEFEHTIDKTLGWLQASRATFEQVAVEASIDVDVAGGVRIVGRADRLEREASGALHIVDLKTSKRALSKPEAADNAQLTAYQLALAHGTLEGGRVVTAPGGAALDRVGGAVLVYPAVDSVKLTTREQAPKSPEELEQFAELVRPLPEQMAGPELLARTGKHCEHCSVRALCPVQPEGQVITRG